MEELQQMFMNRSVSICSLSNWKSFSSTGFKNSSVKIYGSPNYDVHRADLQKALLKIINKEEIQIEKNSEIIDLYEEANGAFIKTKERVIGSDAVIGADGIHSIVSKSFGGKIKLDTQGM